ncbi:MAG: MATE family efflux transporter [Pseudomonadota bacterium]
MAAPGRFTTGSTFRHVAVMTLTGSLGLTFMFLVDFVTLLYVSWLGDERLTSAVGLAWTIQYFTISIGIGFAIAATALVSRSLGAGRRETARRLATSAMVLTTLVMSAVAVAMILGREEALRWLGARGETLEAASRFLLLTLPSLPVMTLGMVGSSVLRAEGDARRAMMVTLTAGVVAAAADPFLIFEDVFGLPGLGLGVDGAAAVMVLSRATTAVMALRAVILVHDLAARPRWSAVTEDAKALLAVATPASATQLSTPFGNALLTAGVAQYGDGAVAGWSVASRMTLLAFGGIFALSGAIGGIIGQNWGAGRVDRVARAYRDALLFCAIYVGVTWAALWSASGWIVAGFGLSGVGAEVVVRFTQVGAGAFVFAGFLFVANSAFNNLGKPIWSTVCNWTRDGAAIPLALWVCGFSVLGLAPGPLSFGAPGVIYAQAAATVALGAAAAIWGLIWVTGLKAPGARRPAWGSAPPLASGRAAAAAALGESAGARAEGLAPRRRGR